MLFYYECNLNKSIIENQGMKIDIIIIIALVPHHNTGNFIAN